MALLAVATLAATTRTAMAATPAPLVVAEAEAISLAINTTSRVATQNLISASRGSFMTVHFAQFNLAPGDKVIVRDAADSTSFEYAGLGRNDAGLDGGFFSSRIPGNQAVIEYVPGSDNDDVTGAFGYAVDKITRSASIASVSKICGTGDQTRPPKCYTNDPAVPQAYIKARAVARLLVDGEYGCTGWLLGSEGHLITNRHCIPDNQTAVNTEYEFDAEGASCSDECFSQGACPGAVVTTSATLVAVDKVFDYALLKLNTTMDLSKYGYLQFRTEGVALNEQIYIPQHPLYYGKRIAVMDDDGDVTRVHSILGPSTCGNYSIGYTADTDDGASGSPVVAASDNLVVALHKCGRSTTTCVNGGTDVRAILWDLKNKGIVVKDAVVDPSVPIPAGPWIPGYTVTPVTTSPPSANSSAPTPAPTQNRTEAELAPVPTVNSCRIFTTQSSCSRVWPGQCDWVDGACVMTPASAR
uniref:Serine protease n=1 Tax=Globisporangium ultimum (strain ATCC 200006 / CBS 805.95 / DAOM BR144) TaxID=431595 RepID=K3WRW9_GLOUD